MKKQLQKLLTEYTKKLLSKLFPFDTPASVTPEAFNELKTKYEKYEAFESVTIFVFVPIMALLLGQLFIKVYESTISHDMNIVFLILPHKLWYLPATLLALSLAKYPSGWLYKAILKDKKDDFILYSNLKNNFDSAKVENLFAVTFGVLTIIVTFLVWDYSVIIYKDKFELNDFWFSSEKHTRLAILNLLTKK